MKFHKKSEKKNLINAKKSSKTTVRFSNKSKTSFLLTTNISLIILLISYWIILIFYETKNTDIFGDYIFAQLNIDDTEVLAIVLTIVLPIIIHSIIESILNIKHSIEKKSKEKNIHIVFETSNQKDFEKFSNSLKSCIFSSAKGNRYVLSSSDSIAFGEDLNKEIKKICKDTDVYIFLFSSSFFENENCLKEMEYIDLYSKDALKIPIFIDAPENIPDKLKDTKYLLLTNIESKKDYTQKICQLANYLIKKEA